jgi:hypothetical protein
MGWHDYYLEIAGKKQHKKVITKKTGEIALFDGRCSTML